MKGRHILSVILSCLVWEGFATSNTSYWQQQCDYVIEVTLNDTLHVLEGFETITYRNNSPDTLKSIFIHLWPNAYRNHETPFAKQLLENGNTAFHRSKLNQRGFIDHIDFKVDAEVCEWDYEKNNLELVRLNLNEPLLPGKSISISTPFRVKIPDNFSRMGHYGQSYQISQWYPKPAVYDKNGWHPMPYLDQGEFYSEFGNFDVRIALPQNYVVGATGNLQTQTELAWMDSIAAATLSNKPSKYSIQIPSSSPNYKTLHYTEENVHDFAWFADKRFHILKGEVELPYTKRKVVTWSLFTENEYDLWLKSNKYIQDAVYYYSKWVGEYPYQQATAIDGVINAGGGMEYPGVTVIGGVSTDFELSDVIAHEVGHNWFYGILGTNEREYPWMDEGINSFYEQRYVNEIYPNQKLFENIPRGIAKFLDIDRYKHRYLADVGYQFVARDGNDQPIQLPANQFTTINYGAIVYGKSSIAIGYLEAYLGSGLFDSIMQQYFNAWKFKHPQPEDLRKTFETISGKNLSWFFDDLIKTDGKIDFSIKNVAVTQKHQLGNENGYEIKLKNLGDFSSPINIATMKGDSVMETFWYELKDLKKGGNFKINLPAKQGFDKIKIDPDRLIPEINRKNNTYFIRRPFHRFEKLRIQLLGSLENQDRSTINFAPYLAWNNYDKTQVGIALYSPFLPSRKFNYMLVPAIGTGSKQFIGIAKLSYKVLAPKIHTLTIGINAKRFSYQTNNTPLLFNKLEPYILVDFKKKDEHSSISQSLLFRSVVVWANWVGFDNKKGTQRYFVNEIRYKLERNTTLHPFYVSAYMRQGNQFMGLFTEANFKISYKRKNEGLFLRFFAGGFPVYFKPNNDITAPLPKVYLSTVTTNNFAYWLQQDYMLDEHFLDRNGQNKILARQVAKTGGAFRSISTFGGTNKFLSSINITSSTHRFFPINPFANAAVVVNDNGKAELAAELGLSVVILRDIVEIHLPLLVTKNITESQRTNGITKWYQRFTFTLKLPATKPSEWIKMLF